MSWIFKNINFLLTGNRKQKNKTSAHTLKKSKVFLKIALGGILFSLFFTGYQPAFKYPPIKKNIVKAETVQTQQVEAAASALTFQLPHPGYLSTPFSAYHPGIDIATGLGMPIKPIAKGKVMSVGYTFWGLGLVVEIEHTGGLKSLYAHMGKTYVKAGQDVDVNDYLGEVGLTGHTSGPHTHLEVFKNDNRIDPRTLLPTIREIPVAEDFATQSAKLSQKN